MKTDSELISKFSNVYIMLLYSIMTNDIGRVKHFISDELYLRFINVINNNKNNNETQMYDELNVHKIDIIDKKTVDDKEVVTVKIISKYMDYVIDSNTGNYKRGENKRRVDKENILTFEKLVNNKEHGIIISCHNCGANLDINFTGKCPYCHSTINLDDYDYILTDIKTF